MIRLTCPACNGSATIDPDQQPWLPDPNQKWKCPMCGRIVLGKQLLATRPVNFYWILVSPGAVKDGNESK